MVDDTDPSPADRHRHRWFIFMSINERSFRTGPSAGEVRGRVGRVSDRRALGTSACVRMSR